MTFIVSNLIKDVLKAHQIERYQAFVLSWRFQGVLVFLLFCYFQAVNGFCAFVVRP